MPNKARSNYHWLICGYFYNISTLVVCMKMVQEIHHIKDCYEVLPHTRHKRIEAMLGHLASSEVIQVEANIDAI